MTLSKMRPIDVSVLSFLKIKANDKKIALFCGLFWLKISLNKDKFVVNGHIRLCRIFDYIQRSETFVLYIDLSYKY